MSDSSYQTYFNDYGYGNGGLAYMADRTYAKLRNITLSWELPKKWVNSINLRSISVSAFVNNAFVWTASDNYYIDPETTTNGTDLAGNFGDCTLTLHAGYMVAILVLNSKRNMEMKKIISNIGGCTMYKFVR